MPLSYIRDNGSFVYEKLALHGWWQEKKKPCFYERNRASKMYRIILKLPASALLPGRLTQV